MKNGKGQLILFLLFVAALIHPQVKQLYGLGPFDWNSSKEEVKAIMSEKFNLLPGYEKEDAIGFEGGKYFDQKIHIWAFFFSEDKLNEADLVINNVNRPVAAIFYEIVHTLSVDYGDPDMFQPDDWTAEWFYYDFTGKKLNATIKISPYSNEKMTSIKISFVKI